MYIEYGSKEIDYLKSKDKKLAKLIDEVGVIRRKKDENFFNSVIHHIIGQQISIKAQQTIWNRLNEKVGEITPSNVLKLPKEELQSIGLTFRKTEYILDFASKISAGTFDIEKLSHLGDEDLIKELTKLKGIGRWTAEMIMIFCLDRKDILSYGDLAIIRGLKKLYGHKEIDKTRYNRYKKRYSPYASIASLYLWHLSKE